MSASFDNVADIVPRRRRARMPLLGVVAGCVVIACLTLAVVGPLIAPYPSGSIVSQTVFGPMTWAHPLGTDYLGRDMFSRVLNMSRPR